MNGHPQHHGALVLVNGRCLMLTHNHGPGGVDSSSVRVHDSAACEPAMSVTGLDEGKVRGSGVREVAQ